LKKIDLHIHTVSTISDSNFRFNRKNLNKYVSQAGLDAIAIANHNEFDGLQFREINETIEVVVFPGIEVNLDGGNILIISDVDNLENFENKAVFIILIPKLSKLLYRSSKCC